MTAAGRVRSPVERKQVPTRCRCNDHSCYCGDYERGWNAALDAVEAMTAPASVPTP